MLSESLYGRTWHTARITALGPEQAATGLARRPYDLRHAALSLWLTATNSPAEIAARAEQPRVLHDTYNHVIHGTDHTTNQHIEQALRVPGHDQSQAAVRRTATPAPPRPSCVRNQPNQPAHGPQILRPGQPAALTAGQASHTDSAVQYEESNTHHAECPESQRKESGPHVAHDTI